MSRSAMFCEHANEVPMACPCDPACYCKDHTCQPRAAIYVPMRSGRQLEKFQDLFTQALMNPRSCCVFMCASPERRAQAWRAWKDVRWLYTAEPGFHDNKNFTTRYSNGSMVRFTCWSAPS